MRIAQVCPRYHPYIGGVETHVKEISETLVEKGFEIEVLTTDPSSLLPKEEIINGVTVKRYKSWAPNASYHFSYELKKYLNKKCSNYDIVHAHSYHALPALYVANMKQKQNLVFTPHYHGKGHTFFRSMLHIPYRHLGKKIFNKSDKIICVSDYEKKLILKNFKINEDKIMIIPNGINLNDFKNIKKSKNNFRTILSVGRLEKYKGMDHLIKILPKLDDDIYLHIIGEGLYKKTLNKIVKRLNIKERVIFFQNLSRDKLIQQYFDADIFILLSRHEAYGISVAEALASRTPCILANNSGLKEWIDNKNCFGINYPIDDDKLIELIHKVIGKETYQSKLYCWEEIVNILAELYNDILFE